jgi:uncharacterized protein (TIGR03000 family)
MKRRVLSLLAIGLALAVTASLAQAQRREGQGGERAFTGGIPPSGVSTRPGGYQGGYSGEQGWWGGRPYGNWYGQGYGNWNYRPYGNWYGQYGNWFDPGYTQYDMGMQGQEQQNPNEARVLVVVPPDANVLIEGKETRQRGVERLFISPPLEQGHKYTYTIRATWTENGKEMSRDKTVNVEPGRMAMANFMMRQDEGQAGQGRIKQYGADENVPGNPPLEQQRRSDEGVAPMPERTRQQNVRPDDRGLEQTPGRHEQPQAQTGQIREGAAHAETLTGKVVRVEINQIVVALNSGGQRTFRLEPDARFFHAGGEKADLNSLKPGLQITITPKRDNPDVITQVEIKSAS